MSNSPGTMRISVITPSYNQAAYLEHTIRSIIDQGYPDLEYILIDGASTDGSRAIIEKYASSIAYWVSESDQGQADAVNKGIGRASGEIVAWLNSDDVYLPGALQTVAQFFSSNPHVGLLYGDLQSIDHNGRIFNTITYAPYTLADLLAFRIIGQPAAFFRRELLDQTGLLDLTYRYLLDHHLWIRLASLAEMHYLPGPLAAARHHPAAKNVAEAAAFGAEVYRILDWASAQPGLDPIIDRQRRRVLGGAHRLNARYLLDGGFPLRSLRSYAQAFFQDPIYTLRHAHRIVYAFLALLGFGWLRKVYNRR